MREKSGVSLIACHEKRRWLARNAGILANQKIQTHLASRRGATTLRPTNQTAGEAAVQP
jgi:hypothetical protein